MAPNSTYDVIIVGSGPGGYVAAVRAAQLGLTVACIEKAPRLGGVCLNVGCIPSKALLDSSEYLQLAKNQFSDHGIKTGRISLDLPVMMARKEKVVQDLTQNVKQLLEGHKVEIIQGTARLAAADQVSVETNSGSSNKKQRTTLSAKAIILATGSETVALPDLPFDGHQIISSTDALKLETVPKHLGIVGGGYIGLELGSVWLRLGAEVSVFEMLPKIGQDVGKSTRWILFDNLKRYKISVKTGARVASVRDGIVEFQKDEREEQMQFDNVILASGSQPVPGISAEVKKLGYPFATVGDGLRVGKLNDAIHGGFLAAMNI